MFKKTAIAAAMLAAASTSVNAVSVNPDGLGQVLLFPFYSVNNGFSTQLNVTNTTAAYKVVKVRFRESRASIDVFDLNLYLSPFDAWTASIAKDSGGVPYLVTSDNSCTMPGNMDEIPLRGVTGSSAGGFLHTGTMNPGVSFVPPGNLTNDDVSEGYIEVFEVGEIPVNTIYVDTTGDGAGNQEMTNAIQHTIYANETADTSDSGVLQVATPRNCAVISGPRGAWAQGIAASVPANGPVGGSPLGNGGTTSWGFNNGATPRPANTVGAGGAVLTTPTGGLSGFAVLVNATTGTALEIEPTALINYDLVAALGSTQHYNPGDGSNGFLPSLASGNVTTSEIFVPSSTPVVGGLAINGNMSMITTSWNPTAPIRTVYTSGANSYYVAGQFTDTVADINAMPVAHVLAADSIVNEFYIENQSTAGLDGNTDWVVTFPMKHHGIQDRSMTIVANAYDHEEQPVVQANMPSPNTGSALSISREVNVLQFRDPGAGNASIVQSPNGLYIDTRSASSTDVDMDKGWINLVFPGVRLGGRNTAATAALWAGNKTVTDALLGITPSATAYAGAVSAVGISNSDSALWPTTATTTTTAASYASAYQLPTLAAAANPGAVPAVGTANIHGPQADANINTSFGAQAFAGSVQFSGVPVIGFAAIDATNGNVSFGEIIENKYMKNVTTY